MILINNSIQAGVCRKTAGGGGYAINLSGEYETLKVEGEEHISIYQAKLIDLETGKKTDSAGKRHFCKQGGSALWLWDPNFVYTFASVIDSELPKPPDHSHMMLSSKAKRVEIHATPNDKLYDEYPQESLAE